jgi:hypothetical protein
MTQKVADWLTILIGVLVVMVLGTKLMASSSKDSKAAVEKAQQAPPVRPAILQAMDSMDAEWKRYADSSSQAIEKLDTDKLERSIERLKAIQDHSDIIFGIYTKTLNQ